MNLDNVGEKKDLMLYEVIIIIIIIIIIITTMICHICQ